MGLLAVFPLSAALAILTKKKFEEMSFFSVCIIIFSILISGLFGTTVYGVYVDYIFITGAVIFCIYALIRKRDVFKRLVCTKGAFALILFYIIAFALYSGYALIGSDTDRLYGPQIANLWMYDDLGGDILDGWLLRVAPLVPIWSYFCLKLWPSYSDGICMMSYFIFCITALLPLFKFIKKNEWLKFLLLFVAVISLFGLNYEESIGVYYIDTATSAVAVYGLIMILESYAEKKGLIYVFEASIAFIILSLIKRVGGAAGFGMISCLAFLTMERLFINKKEDEKPIEKLIPTICLFSSAVISCGFGLFRWDKGAGTISSSYGGVLFFVLWYLTGVCCWGVKELIRRKKYICCCFLVGALLSFGTYEMRRYFDNKFGTGYFKNVSTLFFGILFNGGGFEREDIASWNITPFPIIVIVLFAVGTILYLDYCKEFIGDNTDNEKRNHISMAVSGGYIAWIVMWLAMYMNNNAEDKNYIYCSVRYMCAGPMTICAYLLYALIKTDRIKNNSLLFVVTAVIFMSTYKYPEDIFRAKFCQGRKEYTEIYENAGLELTPENRIFFVNTENRYMSDYYPYFSFPAVSGIIEGGRYSSFEKKMEKITVEELTDIIYSYDYVFVDRIDDDFKKSYDSIFDGGIDKIKDNSVYKVNKENGIQLELLATGDKEYISNIW